MTEPSSFRKRAERLFGDKIYLDPKEAALFLYDEDTEGWVRSVRRSVEAGEFPGVMVGKRWKLLLEALIDHLERQAAGQAVSYSRAPQSAGAGASPLVPVPIKKRGSRLKARPFPVDAWNAFELSIQEELLVLHIKFGTEA